MGDGELNSGPYACAELSERTGQTPAYDCSASSQTAGLSFNFLRLRRLLLTKPQSKGKSQHLQQQGRGLSHSQQPQDNAWYQACPQMKNCSPDQSLTSPGQLELAN